MSSNEIAHAEPWQEARGRVPNGYTLNSNGVSKDESVICGPLWVAAQTMDEDNESWGSVVRWLDKKGNQHERAIPAGNFHDRGVQLPIELANSGLYIVPGKERVLVEYMAAFNRDLPEWRCAGKVGWLESESNDLVYVLPSDTIRATDKQDNTMPVVYQPEGYSASAKTMHSKGNLREWKMQVVEACKNEEYFLFCICVALAAPLLRDARLESGGFHLYQLTSRGKTTAAQVAASVWGCGADPAQSSERSFVRSWNTTINALEGMAVSHNDNLFILDEIGKSQTKDFGQGIYNLFGGQGKGRSNQDGSMRNSRSWRLLVLSTGEESVQSAIEKDGKGKAKGGQMVRMCDVYIADSLILHEKNPARFADQIKLACAENYGTAGPAFLQWICDEFEGSIKLSAKLKNMLDDAHKRLIPDTVQPEISRAGKRFALVEAAGKLAVEAKVLPVTEAQIEKAIGFVCSQWLGKASEMTDSERWAKQIYDFIVSNPGRFLDNSAPSNGRGVDVGYKLETGEGEYYECNYAMTDELLKEASGASDAKSLGQALKEKNLLVLNNGPDRCKSKVTLPGGGRASMYLLRGNTKRDKEGACVGFPGILDLDFS